MRKSAILAGLIALTVCGLLGFFAARQFLDIPPKPTQGSITPVSQLQQNILVIWVDNMDNEKPALQTTWLLMLYKGNPASINFQLIHPSTGLPDIVIKSLFSLDQNGIPSSEFISKVQDEFKIPIHNYVLVDVPAVNKIAAWLNISSLHFDPADTDTIIAEQTRILQAGCSFISSPNVISTPAFDWVALVPDHMRTDLTFDQAISTWKQLVDHYDTLSCEIFQSR
ncbi:MAG TPA: hypothetical protein PKV95_07320 [Anaerolineaceae bacterium]|jgi:hypothetical protein|nr:hypothetical protein [Longilinea sp.]HNS63633.1 hypothetical protein [Anaerolineaceae bacterium]HNZ00277.1 hypothetical protein [Anaerolineaceae bacterium]HQL39273.1 hypothetical protein [Anaerolineaceae bacterium]HQO96657.1 hypothetical protein [Anaerolineaceae bacterium]